MRIDPALARVRHYAPRVLVAALLPPALAAGLVFRHVYFDRTGLPEIRPLVEFEPLQVGRIEDTRGEPLLELALEHRRVVRYPDIPPILREAVLAAEDKNFFVHSGIDYGVLPRVLWRVASASCRASERESRREGRLRLVLVFPQGGSTLTQQLVRGYFLSERTRSEGSNRLQVSGWTGELVASAIGVPATNKLARKLEEVRLSLWVEEEFARLFGSRRAGKEEILARYASFVYLGRGRYGFAAASEHFLGHPLGDLGLWEADEAALLAGMVKSPRIFAPVPGNLEPPQRRRNEVLALMAGQGFITPDLADYFTRQPLRLALSSSEEPQAAAAVAKSALDDIARQSAGRLGRVDLAEGRICVRSTVDRRLQAIVDEALEEGLGRYEARHPQSRGMAQGAVVVLYNGDARVLAETGGRRVYRERSASHTDFNRAVEALRQPGSALKPVVYVAALDQGAQLDSPVTDEPVAVDMGNGRAPKWISNYDGRFRGLIPLRLALAESRNCATMWIAQRVGVARVIETAHRLGIRSPLQPFLSTALGASEVSLLELANVYRTLASGLAAEPQVVDTVKDAEGRLLYQRARDARPVALSPVVLRSIQEALRGVVRLPSGTAHGLDASLFPIAVMGKTGTTTDYRDALFVGSTYGVQGLTVAVRVGFDDNRSLGPGETGGRVALPIFQRIVRRVYGEGLAGAPPRFPGAIEQGIDAFLSRDAATGESQGVAVAVSVASAPGR